MTARIDEREARQRCRDCGHLVEVHTSRPVIMLGRNLGCCAACERDERPPCTHVRKESTP